MKNGSTRLTFGYVPYAIRTQTGGEKGHTPVQRQASACPLFPHERLTYWRDKVA